MIAFILFSVGLAGMIAFITFRIIESAHGVRVFAKTRDALDRAVTRLWRTLVLGDIPRTYRVWFFQAIHQATHTLVVSSAKALRKAEKTLSRIGHRTHPSRRYSADLRSPSPFLKDIGDSKKDGKKHNDSV
ncbi:MAG: hypothetical protein ACJKTH_03730 [Patescibacteria group bacterium UBA2163]